MKSVVSGAGASKDQDTKEEEESRTKLYVGNLSYDIESHGLESAFKKFGDLVSVSVIMDKMSGRNKGFAFVEMADKESADRAIEGAHGQLLLDNGEFGSTYASDSEEVEESSEEEVQESEVFRVIEEASRKLAALVASEPGRLRELEWRDLDRMLAVVFEGIGFSVQLTPSSKDQGKDLIVSFVASGIEHSYYIEIKHWVSGKKVGGTYLKEFVSVVLRDHQDAGIFISTSGFAPTAAESLTMIERTRLRLGSSHTVVSLCSTYLRVSQGLFHIHDLQSAISDLTDTM
jgi:hypothetical protein